MDQSEAYKDGYRNGTVDAGLGRVNRYSYHGTAETNSYSAQYFAGYRRAIGSAQLRVYLRALEKLRAA